jgi:hypothetical protein
MKRGMMATVAAGALWFLLSGCGGGESSSSVVQPQTDDIPVQLPQPSNPADPDEWDSESEETRYTQITSATGNTPPPPPVIVR